VTPRGADINAVGDEYETTPLGMTARWGRREMAAFLLRRGADPDNAGGVEYAGGRGIGQPRRRAIQESSGARLDQGVIHA
jgi:hypothetical protein